MDNKFQFLVYRSAEEDVSVNAVIQDETIWLTQKAMAELFGVQTPAISKHLKNIFDEGELDKQVVISKMENTTSCGRCRSGGGVSASIPAAHRCAAV